MTSHALKILTVIHHNAYSAYLLENAVTTTLNIVTTIRAAKVMVTVTLEHVLLVFTADKIISLNIIHYWLIAWEWSMQKFVLMSVIDSIFEFDEKTIFFSMKTKNGTNLIQLSCF